MEAQREISQHHNDALIGSVQKVIIDRIEGDQYIGRTERDAPEIDNEVFLSTAKHLPLGGFCEVEIVDTSEYDLYGRV